MGVGEKCRKPTLTGSDLASALASFPAKGHAKVSKLELAGGSAADATKAVPHVHCELAVQTGTSAAGPKLKL